ncbi:exodeoxyribonuclease V subunit beta [Candidatus Pantoea edessiphila]|uniref:RecBCD enzyme subunit RecB n=1 Tax=Candidatus Pantoea edessiphila TaxID=2044610 RepID=A0A2P5SVN5_9GAMM|nr:exodeoxyribonuclease V subunit beta [Candidatus Pantoea edessiphila]PPI86399.1 exodeoxyribonuclease V subunit beta [Candidatus Pantoea edessiphila]
MNKLDIKILNPITVPLQGNILIEASAGTGKTFTISLLYLRLLLGLKGDHEYYRPFSIEEILVVTFTEVATIELRNRISNDIHQLRLSCIRGESSNPMHQLLIEQIQDRHKAIERLLFAEQNISNAAIYTMHGFCRKIIKSFVYDLNTLFKNEILSDEYILLKKLTSDFWQKFFCSVSMDIAKIILNEWKNAEDFLFTLYPFFQRKIRYLSLDDDNLNSKHIKNLSNINSIKNIWISLHKDIPKIINAFKINKRVYNNKNLNNWINKITVWANTLTIDYQIPNELLRFRYSEINKENKIDKPINFKLFQLIDELLIDPPSLKYVFISEALTKITHAMDREKNLQGLFSFDDLLYNLDKALKHPNGDLLADNIRNYFPVLLIDEFQDTDPQQYRIFHKIYATKSNLILIIIGDPKQAIYSFRGANIFTYFNMRNEINDVYTLDVNWRSSFEMINSVNCLFSQRIFPFLSSEIPFYPIKPAINNQTLKLIINEKKYPAMRFWIHPNKNIKLIDYEQDIARQCAADINHWLLAKNKQHTFLSKDNNLCVLQASDIVVLVRNRHEASLIRNALNLFCIESVYLSDTTCVYNTVEARELLYLLKAIQYPIRNRLIRTALATSIFSFESKNIELLMNDNIELNILIKKFFAWKKLWQKHGIMSMFRNIISDYNIAENILASYNGKRRLTNLMHIIELLQVKSNSLIGPNDLLIFFSQQINNLNNHIDDEQLRLEEDHNLIRIITIHKSKGLQYPIIWLPFAVSFSENYIIFSEENIKKLTMKKQDRISEDLRLLYVAVTRSIYHCSIGIATFVKGLNKRKDSNDLYKSALGYLLNCDQNTNLNELIDRIKKLNPIDIKLITTNTNYGEALQSKIDVDMTLDSLKMSRNISDDWLILNNFNISLSSFNDIEDMVNQKQNIIKQENKKEILSLNNYFPNNLKFNQFMNNLFTSIDLNKYVNQKWLKSKLNQYGLPLSLLEVINAWLTLILNKPLNLQGLNLAEIKNIKHMRNMKFFLPIRNSSIILNINTSTNNGCVLSEYEDKIHCNQVKGIITGCIDLVFLWHGKYYLLYYKLNCLGESNYCYELRSLEDEIINRSSAMQHNLCTLAFHRYLKKRLHDYSYEKYFGGIFYLFIRGINESSNNGILNIYPSNTIIEKLDVLIGKKKQ